MSEPLMRILLNSTAVLLILAVWATTIAYVTWDTTQRNAAGGRQVIWLLLTAFVPLLGFVAYLIARPFFLPQAVPLAETGKQPQKWVTFLRPAAPAPGVPKRLPTVPAAEYLRTGQPAQKRAARQGGKTENPTYTLAVTEGPHAGENFTIDQLPAVIGRGGDCAIRLDNDRGVSRRHAEFYRKAGRLRVRDLKSTHGTSVNGYEIDDKGLASNDTIRVGHSLLVVKMER